MEGRSIKVLRMGNTKFSNSRRVFLMTHGSEVFLKLVAKELGGLCEVTIFPKELRRLPLNMSFIDWQKSNDSGDRALS